ncbi:hypothetical protein SLEP1_g15002 [Rubroshorea leprosula]|uniref:Uncharacterized protein n=1 Tax=Rubroshorea leprosula TaxID=152421 RepID=A0AAV5IUV2_9ROSI|nr:hypothetical protein SLEP1_g15002 [Rubroshorea leprosula]
MPSIPLPPFYDSTFTLLSAHFLPPLIFSFALAGPSQIPFPPLHDWFAAVEAICLLLSNCQSHLLAAAKLPKPSACCYLDYQSHMRFCCGLALLGAILSSAAVISLHNQCSYTIWPGNLSAMARRFSVMAASNWQPVPRSSSRPHPVGLADSGPEPAARLTSPVVARELVYFWSRPAYFGRPAKPRGGSSG